jgi:hypothetical protein
MTARLGPEAGRVLQGYFRIEQFRGTGRRGSVAAVVQPMSSGRPTPVPAPPRPDLLPAKMLGAAAQLRLGPTIGSQHTLPGMGRATVGGPPRVAQARSSPARSTPLPAGQLRVIGAGRPLEPAIRQAMEEFFQADFSDLRVHEGATAPSIGALAFTLGHELHFAPGLYEPDSREGIELLGHELTHVVQQRDGRVANPYGQGVAIVQDPALEAEADQMGQRIAEQLWARRCARQPVMAIDRRPPQVLTPARIPGMPAPSILAKLGGRIWSRTTGNPIAWPVVQPASEAKQPAPTTGSSAPGASAAAAVDPPWTEVVSEASLAKEKKLRRFDNSQDSKKAQKRRTLCLAAQGDVLDVVSSAAMLESDYNLINKYLPKLYTHLKATNKVKGRTAFVCAEVNAVVYLLHMVQTKDLEFEPGKIRISHSYDENTGRWKAPCPNCRTWLESTGGSLVWTVGGRDYHAREYRLIAKVLPS